MSAGGGPGRRQAPKSGFGRSMFSSVARGAGLVGLAVIIGVVLLQVVDDGTSGSVTNGGSATTTTVASGVTTTTKPGTTTTKPGTTTTAKPATSSSTGPTTTTAAPRAPAQVRVLVQNGSGVAGAAGAATTQLRTAGYQTDPAADADQRRVGTVAYYKAGYQADANAVLAVLNRGGAVEPIGNPPPTGSANANVVVILGS